MKTLNILQDPPDASLIETWRKRRSRCESLRRLGSVSIAIQFLSSVVLVVLSSLSLLPAFSFLSGPVLWPFIFCVVFLVLLSFFTGRILRQCSAAGVPTTDDLDPASPSDLARLSAFLGTEESKVYLQKVAQQQRLLMRMEYRMLIAAPDDLKRDAFRREQLALVERETGLRVSQ